MVVRSDVDVSPPGTTAPGRRRIRGLDPAQRQAQRRDQLLDAALDLFATDGYLGTSIEQICQTAYVGTKGFYEVFDSKETCFVALLQSISEQLQTRVDQAGQVAPDDERAAMRLLLETLCHGLVDDPRVAQVTFGHASGISPAVERARRANRRWAAEFVVAFWDRHHPTGAPATAFSAVAIDRRVLAIGFVGGLFDLIGDWLFDRETTSPSDTEDLIAALVLFSEIVRAGLDTVEAGRTDLTKRGMTGNNRGLGS